MFDTSVYGTYLLAHVLWLCYELFLKLTPLWVDVIVFPFLCMYILVDEKNIKACGLFLPPDLVSPSWLFGSPSGNYSRGIFPSQVSGNFPYTLWYFITGPFVKLLCDNPVFKKRYTNKIELNWIEQKNYVFIYVSFPLQYISYASPIYLASHLVWHVSPLILCPPRDVNIVMCWGYLRSTAVLASDKMSPQGQTVLTLSVGSDKSVRFPCEEAFLYCF